MRKDDYELVCPYFRMGCSETCRRSTVTQHLKHCRFARNDTVAAPDADIYEVMCPYARLGCRYSGSRAALGAHVDNDCKFRYNAVFSSANPALTLPLSCGGRAGARPRRRRCRSACC